MPTIDPPQTITDLADAVVRAVKQALDLELDYTQDTLSVLDHYMDANDDLESDEVRQLVISTAGAYFGEVVRRHLKDGQWHCPDGNHKGWRLESQSCFLFFNPLGVAYEVLDKDSADGWFSNFNLRPEDKDTITDVLERTGSVSEDDFYTFAVRFEVAEQIHALLTAMAAEAEVQPGTTPQDYEAHVRRKLAQAVN